MRRPLPKCKRLIVGITGSFGSGKTTVARIFKSLGTEVIDADRIAHKVIQPGTRIYRKIINTFGAKILKEDRTKTIDRNKLAKVVFDNKIYLNKLNRIIHPQVIRIIKSQIRASKAELIVLDVPLLIEAGLRKFVDKLIVVKINRREQIKRIIKKAPFSKTDILKRIRSQIPLRQKVRLADFVIDNTGTIEETRKQVEKIWKKQVK